MPTDNSDEWIPNIVMGQDYDKSYADAPIHYERLENLAGFFARDMPVHRHVQYFQIHYIDTGVTNFHMDDRIYRIEKSSCFLTPPSVPHSFQTEEGTTGHVLTIHQSVIWRLMRDGLQNYSDFDLKQGIGLDATEYDTAQQSQWALIGQTFANIGGEWRKDHAAKNLMLENFTRLLIIQIARLSSNNANYSEASNDALRLFRLFTDLIDDHYTKHWPLPHYTELLGVSESRLNQICRNISNSPPKKLITDRLLQEAKRRLTFSNFSAKEISYQLGFSDPAYFSRFFRRETKMTAQQYRKAHMENQFSNASSEMRSDAVTQAQS